MSKRFTDTNKWRKPFIRGLQGAYKLFWFYLLDDCDHAGIWIVDMEVAEIRIGEKLDEKEAIKLFNTKIKIFDNNERWFIPDFIEFQYGKLNEANRAHNSVIIILSKYKLINKNKDLISPLQGAKDKDKDKDKEKEKEKELVYPFDSLEFMEIWNYWKEYKSQEFKFKYKSVFSEQAALTELSNLSNCNLETATAIIKQSMSNGWKGLFDLKNESKITIASIEDDLKFFRDRKESGYYER